MESNLSKRRGAVRGGELQLQAVAAAEALQAAKDEAEREAAAAALAEAEAEAEAEREEAEAALKAARAKQKPKPGYTAINQNVKRELENTWQEAKEKKKYAKKQADFIKLFGGSNMIRREEQEAQVNEDVSVGGHSSHSGEDRDGIKMTEEFIKDSKRRGGVLYGVADKKKVVSYGERARKDALNAKKAEKIRLRCDPRTTRLLHTPTFTPYPTHNSAPPPNANVGRWTLGRRGSRQRRRRAGNGELALTLPTTRKPSRWMLASS